MPLLFSKAAEMDNAKRIANGEKPLQYLILTATSGDTGKAALEGFKNKKNIFLIIFYPKGHVSTLQEKQMVTQEGDNLAVYATESSFDTVQKVVKNIFTDDVYNKKLLNDFQTKLSSANSINWGRFIPQIVYHIKSYLYLVQKDIINCGEPIDVAVPSGNFGNILAAFLAKQMGVPINKLICASNENNALAKFIQTGTYDIRNKEVVYTPSPAIDILVASNIERLLYFITQDTQQVALWMQQLKTKKVFSVDENTKKIIQNNFYADWVSNQECLRNIKQQYEQTSYLMDPHTSVAQVVTNRYQKEYNISSTIIICSTAHWAKFAGHIDKALFNKTQPNEFASLDYIAKHTGLDIPKSIADLKTKPVIHTKKLFATQEVIEETLIKFLNIVNQTKK